MHLDTPDFGKIIVKDPGNKHTATLLQLSEEAGSQAAITVARSADTWEFISASHVDAVITAANRNFYTRLHDALQDLSVEIRVSQTSSMMKQ